MGAKKVETAECFEVPEVFLGMLGLYKYYAGLL
jgi:hypothetical protein